MRPTLPLLQATDFPAIKRRSLETLQVNLGYKCNQSCLHCHVNAGPNRKEMMTLDTIGHVIDVLRHCRPHTLDLTGGAPELNEHFRHLVRQARALDVTVIDRCNLTILSEPGQQDLAQFLAEQAVQVTASLPCYSPANVDRQRGDGVFERSIAGLKMLNLLGYGKAGSGLVLNLVYNPQGPSLPPPQDALEQDYKRELKAHFGVEFNHLFTITNMPIQRFGSTLVSKGTFRQYMTLLKSAYRPENLDTVMCRSTISVDWQGDLYDCDFNQMLGLGLKLASSSDPAASKRGHIRDLLTHRTNGLPVHIADHCYGCTAGQGSSCTGALDSSSPAPSGTAVMNVNKVA
ncbi:arsenosugar biosynthesis radical SAM (seleno)protein ArsS [Orrella marina]|uniref:Radical SAM protein n=1 Tax=Orrella marina TaxID=2163011 RepID=A0A2R4XI59_9BURK|nr:arsenosugar biosynthesis radical SAM (seleno)protein ArsS [Orrella marina]AWB33399.1 radical SAM protein [Orrella marina]